MNPVELKRGRSFKGLAKYLLHDQQSDTSERVGWTQSYNLGDADPNRAWQLMAATAMSADSLQIAAGKRPAPNKNKAPVYHFTITWPDVDGPSDELQRKAVQESLEALGFAEHQAVAVQHTDGKPHVHVMVNLIHPENGSTAKLSYTQKKLRKWADKFELTHGLQLTDGSHNKAEKLANGEKVDSRRKPRNIYEQEAREGVERRTAWMRELHDKEKRELRRISASMKAQHSLEWDRASESYQNARKALYEQRDAEIERKIIAIKASYKKRWAETFKESRDNLKRFEQSEQSTLLKAWNIGKTFVRARKQGDDLTSSVAGALMKDERRGFVELDNEKRQKAVAIEVRRSISASIKRIREGYKEHVSGERARFLKQCDDLKKQHSAAWKIQRQRWKVYNRKRKQAQNVIAGQGQQFGHDRGQDLGRGYDYGFDPE